MRFARGQLSGRDDDAARTDLQLEEVLEDQ
jgi:hypothetical protein